MIRLGDLQARRRAQERRKRRRDLRRYLIERRVGPTSAAFNTVARRLYAEGAIDNLGLADAWIGTASLAERAALFSDIATALLAR